MIKRKYIITAIVFACIGGLLSVLFLLQNHKWFNTSETEEFSLSSYSWELQNFSADKNVEEVGDKEEAVRTAKSLWLEKYNVDFPKSKIKVAYDTKEECWHVYGTVSPKALGGVYHAIILKSGKVLAIWIDD